MNRFLQLLFSLLILKNVWFHLDFYFLPKMVVKTLYKPWKYWSVLLQLLNQNKHLSVFKYKLLNFKKVNSVIGKNLLPKSFISCAIMILFQYLKKSMNFEDEMEDEFWLEDLVSGSVFVIWKGKIYVKLYDFLKPLKTLTSQISK